MTKLTYITHPSVQISAETPIDKWKLSEKGVAEAQHLLKLPFWNEVNVIYSSTEHKASKVAEMASKKF